MKLVPFQRLKSHVWLLVTIFNISITAEDFTRLHVIADKLCESIDYYYQFYIKNLFLVVSNYWPLIEGNLFPVFLKFKSLHREIAFIKSLLCLLSSYSEDWSRNTIRDLKIQEHPDQHSVALMPKRFTEFVHLY